MNYQHQSNQSCVDEVNQQNSDNLHTDQQSLSPPKKIQKRQRKPSKTSTSGVTQKSTHNNELEENRQYSSSNFNGVASMSGYPSSYAPYRHPTSSPWYVPTQGQHPLTMQTTKDAISMQLNPMHHPWNFLLPSFPTSSTPYANTLSQFSQNRETTPTVQNSMSSTYYGNQSSLWQSPLSAPSGMFPYSSTIAQSSGPIAPNVFKQIGPVLQRSPVGSSSAFHMYQPSNGGVLRFSSESSKTATSSSEAPASIFDFESAISSLNDKVIDSTEKEINFQKIQQVSSENDQTVDTYNGANEKYDFFCVICQDAKKDTVIIPCRHLCVCQKCSKNIDLCPMCRNKCDLVMTVFL